MAKAKWVTVDDYGYYCFWSEKQTHSIIPGGYVGRMDATTFNILFLPISLKKGEIREIESLELKYKALDNTEEKR